MEHPSGTADEQDGGMVPLFSEPERGLEEPAERGDPGEGPEEEPEADDAADELDLFGDDDEEDPGDETGDEPDDDSEEEEEGEAEGDEDEESDDSEDEKPQKAEAQSKLARRVQKLARSRRHFQQRAEKLDGELSTIKGQLETWQQVYPGAKGLENARFDRKFMDNLVRHKEVPVVREAIRYLTGQGPGAATPPREDRAEDRGRGAAEQDPNVQRAIEAAERVERREAERGLGQLLRKGGVLPQFHKALTKAALSELDLKKGVDEESLSEALRKAIRESGFSRDFLKGAKKRGAPPTGGGRGAARVIGESRERELAGGKGEKPSDKPKTQAERYARANRRLAAMVRTGR